MGQGLATLLIFPPLIFAFTALAPSRTIQVASMNLFDLTGEVAAVIGGTGVLGGAMAEGLAQAGARVALLGRNAERGQARADRIKAEGGQARFVPADAQQLESLKAALQQVEAAFGPPTILLNAAGGNDLKVTVGPQRTFQDIA